MSKLKKIMAEKERVYEQMCTRCGACCGAYDGDPCRNLCRDNEGYYYCKDYGNRLGMQKTINGVRFKCVMIREIINESWIGDHRCAYKKQIGL